MPATTRLFNIRTVDSSGEEKLTNRISTEAEIDAKATLGTVRNVLAQEKKLDSGKARLAFCGKDGARVGDDMKWSVYQAIVVGDEKDESKTSNDIQILDVYLELPEEKEKKKELSAAAQKVLDSDLDMDLMKNKPELISATLKELASKYNHANFKAGVSKEGVVVAGSMSEEDWDSVLRNTQYLNGHRMVFTTYANGTKGFKRIDKAPYTAFSLKPRKMASTETADKSIKLETEYRIPRYIVTDDSYVNVFETATELSKSVASSSFSQLDIEASAGGNVFGASLSAKAGFSQSESQAMASSQSSSARTMNITYNFPRVVLHLDPRSLELTDECKTAVQGVTDEASLVQFHHNYGHFFSTNLQLGGKLYASEQFTSSESANAEEKSNAMKASAAASFSYGTFQASASVSYEENGTSSGSNQSSKMSNSLTWEAQGGDTILCNDPPNWCHTVKPFNHWRVINQQDVLPLVDFIGSFTDFSHIPKTFADIVAGTRKPVNRRFRLRAKEKELVGANEYYGLREDASKRRLEPLLIKYSQRLQKDARPFASDMVDASIFYLQFQKRVESESFTNKFKEYVGIDQYDDGCDFEVELQGELNQAPKLQYNVPYLIRTVKHQRYLCADTSGSYKETFFGYMFYARKSRASKFMFRQAGARQVKGDIDNGKEVELTLCDETGSPIARVQRYEGDGSTLMLSKFGVSNDFSVENNAYMTYIEE
ncbi:unnamed protein product [Penicillium pancosmium]